MPYTPDEINEYLSHVQKVAGEKYSSDQLKEYGDYIRQNYSAGKESDTNAKDKAINVKKGGSGNSLLADFMNPAPGAIEPTNAAQIMATPSMANAPELTGAATAAGEALASYIQPAVKAGKYAAYALGLGAIGRRLGLMGH